MKKTYSTIIILLMFLLGIESCKKDSNTGGDGGETTFVPAYIAPTEPGIMQVSQNSLILHVGNAASVNAKIYDSDGTIQSVQPTFIWNTDNSSVATVSAGVITAQSIGTATISVTDGSHGLVFVSITVVDNSVTIPSDKNFIVFNQPVISLTTGASSTFSFLIKNASGQTVSGTPVFYTSVSSGISISGNSITAGTVPGIYTIIAVNGTDTLTGTLQVVVTSPSSTTADTFRKIKQVHIFPTAFIKPGLTSPPVRIEILETSRKADGSLYIRNFQTSPDAITISHKEVVNSNSSGQLTSVTPGSCLITLKYRNANPVKLYSTVGFYGAGTWSGGSVNLCIPDDYYGNSSGIWFFNYFYKGGNQRDTSQLLFSGCNLGKTLKIPGNLARNEYQTLAWTAGFVDRDGNPRNIGLGPLGPLPDKYYVLDFRYTYEISGGCNTTISGAQYIDNDHIIVHTENPTSDITLIRGTGNCSASNDTSQYIIIDGIKDTMASAPTGGETLDSLNYRERYREYGGRSGGPILFFGITFIYKSPDGRFGLSTKNLLLFDSDAPRFSGLTDSNFKLDIYYEDVSTGNGNLYESQTNGTGSVSNGFLTFNGTFTKRDDATGNIVGTSTISGKVRFPE